MHLTLAVYGTQEAIENWIIGEITLPTRPNQVTDDNPAQLENFDRDGQSPVVISTSPGARVLTIGGSICDGVSTKAQLNAAYCVPLRAMKGTVQAVVDPNQVYIGDWMVRQVTFREVAEGKFSRFAFQIVLVQSDVYIDLSAQAQGD